MRACLLFITITSCLLAEFVVRERLYPGAVRLGGQVVPLFDKGYLIYLHQPNRLQVFRPDGQVAYDMELACPGAGTCSATGVSVDSAGSIAVGFAYWTRQGRASGVRILGPEGRELRFIDTSPYVPTNLCFDRNDQLWSIGRPSDAFGGISDPVDYEVVRKFSPDGKEVGRYLPRSMWPNKKAQPGRIGRGYWHMYAAEDRIGAIFHANHADNPAEWIEWDFHGNILSRTVIPSHIPNGRAYTSDGRLFGRFRIEGKQRPELRMLDTRTREWRPMPANLPESVEFEGAFLLGSDGSNLVYQVGYGNVRLLWVRPGSL